MVNKTKKQLIAELKALRQRVAELEELDAERKQADEQTKQLQEYLQLQIDRMPIGLIVWDTEFHVQTWNPAAEKIFGFAAEEALQKHPYDLIVPKEAQPHVDNIWHRLLEGDMTAHSTNKNITKGGRTIICEWSNTPLKKADDTVVGVLSMVQDITERKRMQEQLIVTDRLASIGELAAGIAHEINNPLTSVIGFSQLLLGKDMPDDVKEDVKIIYNEARRAAEVVSNLLLFARKHTPVKQLISINEVIGKVLQLRAYEQRVNNIQVVTRFAPDLPEIMADYFQLQQVFLNIIINAEHFMIETHQRGTLTITTEITVNIIKASFTDDGPGIPEENLGHLFDPFFTTKEMGQGTGLGLSICHGLVTEHGGRIYVESALDKGATFIVELPI